MKRVTNIDQLIVIFECMCENSGVCIIRVVHRLNELLPDRYILAL